jgi:hypothetical protein
MGVSEVTVKVHRHRLMNKLGAKSLPDLVRMAELLHVEPFAIDKIPGRVAASEAPRQGNDLRHKG